MQLDIEEILSSLPDYKATTPYPVDQWAPEREGQIDIRIDSQADWYHEGGRFERLSLTKLFSSILKYEGNQYFLVTPAEKLKIEVEDVPFLIKAAKKDKETQLYHLITNTEDVLTLDETSHWELRDYQGVLVPYVEVRNNLFARLDRNTFYSLVEEAEAENTEAGQRYYITSSSNKFTVGIDE